MNTKHRATLFFEPLDVLFFRDNRPGYAGQNAFRRIIFPLPSVFLGCVRAALFRALGADFRKKDFGIQDEWARALLGNGERVGSLQLYGPLLAKKTDRDSEHILEPLFHLPADIAQRKDDSREENSPPSCLLLARERLRDIKDGPTCYRRTGDKEARLAPAQADIAWTPDDIDKPKGTLVLTKQGMETYIAGNFEEKLTLNVGKADDTLAKADALFMSQVLLVEDRQGIARDPERLTTEEHMLYTKQCYRLAPDYGFAVEVEVPEDPAASEAIRSLHRTLVTLGGWGHRARVTYHEQPLVSTDMDSGDQIDKAIFLTPAPLAEGVDTWREEGMSGIVDRLVAVGGFDQAKRRPRPLRQALPAGTVVYAKSGQTLDDVIKNLCGFDQEGTPSSDGEPERLRRAGFAWALGQTKKARQ